MFKKIIFAIFIFSFFSASPAGGIFHFSSPAHAANEFSTSYNIAYTVAENGITSVAETVELTNLTSSVYASEFTVKMTGPQIGKVRAYDSQGEVKTTLTVQGEETIIHLVFNDKIAGQGKTLVFSIHYDTPDIAGKNGNIWEIVLPKVHNDENTKGLIVSLVVPQAFGTPSYIKPQPYKSENRKYEWRNEQLYTNIITAGFGERQYYSLGLTYHLYNTSSSPIMQEIALPPDTYYQRVWYQKLEPAPITVEVDEDGNWLARYVVSPNSSVSVKAKATAEVYSSPRPDASSFLGQPDKAKYLGARTYWEVNDKEISRLSKELKTPEAIYKFVISTLDYDEKRIDENPRREGARWALANKNKAVCMEFTDLFIALARAAGIPAREVNGYAYTTNTSLRPLSLVSDVLHAWPEYYDTGKKVWIAVDPTWGRTTGGIDYFSVMDFNHIAFSIHGIDSSYPYPVGSYKLPGDRGRDVEIEFAPVGNPPHASPGVSYELPNRTMAGGFIQGNIIVENSTGVPFYNSDITLNTNLLSPGVTKISVPVLPPFGRKSVPISWRSPNPFLWSKDRIQTSTANDPGREVVIEPFYANIYIYVGLFSVAGLILGLIILKISRRRQ